MMVIAQSEEGIQTKSNLSPSGVTPPNRIAATTSPQVQGARLVSEPNMPYLALIPRFSRQLTGLESASFIDSISSHTALATEIIRLPGLEWPAKTHPILTNSVRTLLETLWAIVVSRATQLRFPLEKTVVSIFTDPNERESKAILRLTCNTNITQAMAFWDSLEPDLQDWLKHLTERERIIFITKISLRVYWLT